MNRIGRVARLHLNKWGTFVVTPALILALVFVIGVVIQLAIQRAGVDVSSPEYVDGARMNSSVIWSLPGFLIYYGVQGVATTYPFALALGTTRRNFVLGTLVANAVQAVYISVLLVALLGLELATGHWFINAYIFDVAALGSGDPLVLALTSFIGVLVCLTVGGLFGAIWARFGAKGPALLGLALGLAIALVVLLIAPQFVEIVTSITRGGLAVAAIITVGIAMIGTWFAMRRASIR